MADHLNSQKSLLFTVCDCFLLGSFSSTGIASGMAVRAGGENGDLVRNFKGKQFFISEYIAMSQLCCSKR